MLPGRRVGTYPQSEGDEVSSIATHTEAFTAFSGTRRVTHSLGTLYPILSAWSDGGAQVAGVDAVVIDEDTLDITLDFAFTGTIRIST